MQDAGLGQGQGVGERGASIQDVPGRPGADARQALQAVARDGLAPATLGRIQRVEAELVASSGNAEGAAELLRRPIDLLAQQPLEQALARAALAGVLIDLGRVDDATAHIAAAKRVSSEFLYRPLEAEALHLEAREALARGQREAALAAARRIDPGAAPADVVPTELTATVVLTLGGPDARLTPLTVRADPHNTLLWPPRRSRR